MTLHNSALAHMDSDPGGGFKKLNHLLSLRARGGGRGCALCACTQAGARRLHTPLSAHHLAAPTPQLARTHPGTPRSLLPARGLCQPAAAVRVARARVPGPGRRRHGGQSGPGAAPPDQGVWCARMRIGCRRLPSWLFLRVAGSWWAVAPRCADGWKLGLRWAAHEPEQPTHVAGAPCPCRPQDVAELLSTLVHKASAPDDALARLDALAGRHTSALRTLTKRLQVQGGWPAGSRVCCWCDAVATRMRLLWPRVSGGITGSPAPWPGAM